MVSLKCGRNAMQPDKVKATKKPPMGGFFVVNDA
jgi:hypothetical protein